MDTDARLPRAAGHLVVVATGGTIAGRSARVGDNVGYHAAELGAQELLEPLEPWMRACLPGWTVRAEQLVQLDSKDMDEATWALLAQRLQVLLADPSVSGVVVTHGTDTAEETAFVLARVLAPRKPVVLTCAMRPATALSPDGPQNVLDALCVAADARAAGVWLVASGAVHGAHHVAKLHPYRTEAFASPDAGPAAWVEEGRVRWVAGEPVAPALPPLGIGPRELACVPWPRVEVVMSHGGAQPWLLQALAAPAADGAPPLRGLVVAGTGNGTVHRAWEGPLARLSEAGVVIWRSSRCVLGVPVAPPEGRTGGGVRWPAVGLPPVKARLELALRLLAGAATGELSC